MKKNMNNKEDIHDIIKENINFKLNKLEVLTYNSIRFMVKNHGEMKKIVCQVSN